MKTCILHILMVILPVLMATEVSAQCPGAGNNPCSAVPITVNGSCVPMTNTNCTNFTNPGTCNSGAFRDVWGVFTVGAETEITISWVSTLSRDGVLHLYHLPAGGNCNNISDFVLIACADNNGSILGNMETISASLITGETYYIRGQRYNSNTGMGAATMCVTGLMPPDCSWSVCISDSYGDGWNGGNIHVYSDGVSVGTWTLSTGAGPVCYNIPVYTGGDIFIDYTAGSWGYENSYSLYDSYGNLVYTDGNDGSAPADYTYTAADCDPHPVTPNEQDCLGAIPICGDSYSTTESYSGTGNIPGEINGSSSCLSAGERNDVWYIFTVQQDGNLMFTITPNDTADDYDWAVYNLTTASCSDIYSDPSLEVSCNYSGTAGTTGPDGSTSFTSQDGGGTPFNAAIPVQEGEIYVINVSNYSSTQYGYFIDFSMASGVIVDVNPPELDTIVNSPTCGEEQITFWFNEPVDTASVNSDDFAVTGPGGSYNVISIQGTGGSASDREYLMTLNTQLIAGGTYTLSFSGQVDDACGNSVIGNSLDFTVNGIIGSVLVNDGMVVCYDDAAGTATASATGGSGTYSYLWETGATTAMITGLPAGDYLVTISDDVGVCYDIVTADVNPANELVPSGTWAGTISSDWYNCSNWGGGYIPVSSTDVTIPGGCSHYPIFSVNTTINGTTGICNSIEILSGGALTINNNKDLTVNNSDLRIEAGGTLFVDNDIFLVSGGMLYQNGGDINLNGDFSNSATFTSVTGTFYFTGSSIQSVLGTNTSSFFNLTLNNSGSGMKIETNITVNGNLTLLNGDIDLEDNHIDLGTTGILVSENATNRITATNGSGLPGPGTIKATRMNPTGNVAGLGLFVTPSAPLGNTTITRGHEELNGTGSYAGNTSILRYYDIVPGAKAVIPCDFTLTYFDSELNGHTDGTLVMFQEVQMTWGGVPGPVYMAPLSTINDALANTAFATTINNNLSHTKVTLGSQGSLLPVTLKAFTASCETNSVKLEWTTCSERDNDYFTIEKSYDGITFEHLAKISGSGNSDATINYEYPDFEVSPLVTYYRLWQTDYDGKTEMLSLKAVTCGEEEQFSIELLPNGDNNFSLISHGCSENHIYYYLTDQLGKVLMHSGKYDPAGYAIIDLSDKPSAIYNLVVICGDHVVVEKIFNK
ncbi:MAG TPA: hypothetical protein DEA97_01180 [Bacteroidales bacterium]|nr:hypothetical protein [Bacteroidales bacterium]